MTRPPRTSATSWTPPTGSPPPRRSSTARSSRSTSVASPTSRCSRRASRAGEWPPAARSSTRSSTSSSSTADRSSTSRSRSGDAARSVLRDGPARPPERARRGRRDSPSSRRPGCGASRASWPRTAGRRTSRARARRRWQKVKIRPEQELVVGGWVAGNGGAESTLGALLVGVYEDGCPALRRQGRGRLHERDPGRAAGGRSRPLATDEPPFSPRRLRAAARELDLGSARSSSSAPSSPAGPATAWSARRPTRASTSARTRVR